MWPHRPEEISSLALPSDLYHKPKLFFFHILTLILILQVLWQVSGVSRNPPATLTSVRGYADTMRLFWHVSRACRYIAINAWKGDFRLAPVYPMENITLLSNVRFQNRWGYWESGLMISCSAASALADSCYLVVFRRHQWSGCSWLWWNILRFLLLSEWCYMPASNQQSLQLYMYWGKLASTTHLGHYTSFFAHRRLCWSVSIS